MIARGFEGGLYIVPGCSGRLSAARLRRACGGPFSCGCRSDRYSPESFRSRTPRHCVTDEHRFVYGQEPHTKSKKHFPLELRAKTRSTNSLFNLANHNIHVDIPIRLGDSITRFNHQQSDII